MKVPPRQMVEETQKLGGFATISQQARRAWMQGQLRDRMATANLRPWLVTMDLRLGGKRANNSAPAESHPKKKK